MTMRKFDASIWNLGAPLGALVLGCGPLVPSEETDTETTDPTQTTDPTDPSSTKTTDPTDPTGPTQCPEIPCPAGYECVDGVCEPYYYCLDYCCDDGGCCYGGEGCCYGDDDCGWYDCYGVAECGAGSFCEGYGYCNPIPYAPQCDSMPAYATVPALDGYAMSLAFVDVDGDAAHEIAVVGDGSVLLLPGGGGTAVDLGSPVGATVQRLDAGDLDGDGDEDIAVLGGGLVGVLQNDGAGNFTASETSEVYATRIAIGDFDGNGIGDLLASTDTENDTRIYLGLPGFSFQPASSFSFSGNLFSDGIAQLDGGGGTDVLLQTESELDLWFGDASPGGGPDVTFYDWGGFGGRVPILAPGDFDGDGFDDIARVLEVNGWSLVDSWLGGDLFELSEWGWPLDPQIADAGDIDGDGRDDLVIQSGATVLVRYGAPYDGEVFGCAQIFETGVPQPWGMDVGDYDGDGRADIAFAHEGGVSVLAID